MANHKRKSVLVQRKLQLKLIGIFLVISCLAALLQIGLMAQSFLAIAQATPEGAEQIRTALPGLLARNLGWTLMLLVPFIFLVGMNLTNKVAGPAYSIHKYLGEVLESGRISRPCSLRQGDELVGLANAVNAALARIDQDRDPNRGTQQ